MSDKRPEGSATRVSGVRTEHQLRVQLRDALERNTTFERALREAASFAYGDRDLTDLRRLKAALSSAGFPDPNLRRSHPTGDDGAPNPGNPPGTG
jgi:hypothetical protein